MEIKNLIIKSLPSTVNARFGTQTKFCSIMMTTQLPFSKDNLYPSGAPSLSLPSPSGS